MKPGARIAIVALLAVAVTVTVALRGGKRAEYAAAGVPAVAAKARPRILELGSRRCQACLEMAKVLDVLRASQGTKLQVDFIDPFEEPAAADHYIIAVTPTQILYGGVGKEIFRQEDFLSQDDILAKFREHGVKL